MISVKFFFFISIIFCSLSLESIAQDSLKIDTAKEKTHSPKFAGFASAILPGAGQVYNQKYWKVPIVYAGLATAGYFIYYNANVYSTVKKNLDSRVAGDSVPDPQYLVLNNIFSKSSIDLNTFNYDDLILIQEEYRKYLTLSIIAGTIVYVLNIVDAVVDAHLFTFDVGDNLTMNVMPEIFQVSKLKTSPGVSLTFSFK